MILMHNQFRTEREIHQQQQQHTSLVESKKIQWAKERAEMAMLGKTYSRSNQYEKTSIRSHYYSSIDLSEHADEKTYQNLIPKDYKPSYEHTMPSSSNLPPIVHNKYRMVKNNSEEETSGYMTESHPSSGSSGEWRARDSHFNHHHHQPQQQQQYFHNGAPGKKYRPSDIDSVKLQSLCIDSPSIEHSNAEIYYHNDINESERGSSKYRRPDQYYYQSQGHSHRHPNYNISAHSMDTPMPATPSSVASQTTSVSTASQYNNNDISSTFGGKSKEERAKWNYLYDPNNKDSRRSSQSGPIWLEKGLIELQKSESSTSFLRGQNIPVDPAILAERETKRRKAMELQIAIKQQLEEREKRKKWEKERILLEERLEEERLRKQLENERKRLEQERKALEEKEESKRKKEEMMRQALEKAAQDAKLEKERRKRSKGLSSRSEDTLSVDDYSTDFEKERNDDESTANFGESNSENVEEKVSAGQKDVNDEEVTDDGEQILIGTPIKLRKKDVEKFRRRNKSSRPVDSEESDHEQVVQESPKKKTPPREPTTPPKTPPKQEMTDLNGIALLFQNITPVVPLQFQSNLCLISPLTNIANYPLALMLAQQQQQKFDNRSIHTPMSSEAGGEKTSTPKGQVEERPARSPGSLPHDGTFTKEPGPTMPRFDAATSTVDDEQHKLPVDFRNYAATMTPPERDTSWTSVSTQTEETQSCEFCRATNYHLLRGHNKHHDVFLKETVTSVVQTKKSKAKDGGLDEHTPSQPEANNKGTENQEMMTTTTTTTTTMIRSKSRERKGSKLDERPKWGVNRPLMQYLKASERDCYSLRNRRKRYLKKTDETKSCEAFRTLDDGAGTVEENSSRHNVCTEILPIKTDGQGNVYLVRRNSFILNESSFLNRKPNGNNVCKKLLLRSSSQQSKVTKVKDDFDTMVGAENLGP